MTVERLAKDGHFITPSVRVPDRSGGCNRIPGRGWRLIAGGRGRVDLVVVTDDRETMLIIIEIKGTDWDKVRADRVKRNVQRHIRQLLAYLDTAIGELEAVQWDGHRPSREGTSARTPDAAASWARSPQRLIFMIAKARVRHAVPDPSRS